jgi:hypothetical protein
MTHTEHSPLVRLITETVNQYATADPCDLAEHIVGELEGGYQIVKSYTPQTEGLRFRPHLWPQPSGVTVRVIRCLNCGAAFGERRAEDPCQPPE